MALAAASCTDDRRAMPPQPTRPTAPDAPDTPPVGDYGLSGVECGTVVRDHVGGVAQAPVDCLLGAVAAGRAANLVVTGTTVEGDIVFSAYQVAGVGVVDVVHDARWDNFGSLQMTRQRCTATDRDGGYRGVEGDEGRSLRFSECQAVP